MLKLINWPCPSCGTELEEAAETSRVTCEECGNEGIIVSSTQLIICYFTLWIGLVAPLPLQPSATLCDARTIP